MAELFDKSVKTISEHVQNVFAEGELQPEATIRKSRIVQDEAGCQAAREFEKYDAERRRLGDAALSDFDKAVDGIKKLGKPRKHP
jgi:hypothetical protein